MARPSRTIEGHGLQGGRRRQRPLHAGLLPSALRPAAAKQPDESTNLAAVTEVDATPDPVMLPGSQGPQGAGVLLLAVLTQRPRGVELIGIFGKERVGCAVTRLVLVDCHRF